MGLPIINNDDNNILENMKNIIVHTKGEIEFTVLEHTQFFYDTTENFSGSDN